MFSWLKSTELFARPAKEIPGKWQLFEYYTETEGELVHLKEKQLKEMNQYWHIEFNSGGQVIHTSNLPVSFLHGSEHDNWQIIRNFITLYSSEKIQDDIKFQFAIEKQQLKLLKKDPSGRIEIFGFFRKMSSDRK